MLPEQKEQVEHAAGRSVEPAGACGTQLERGPGSSSSDSGQVDNEMRQTGQMKAPEEDGEEQGTLEHCIRAKALEGHSKE